MDMIKKFYSRYKNIIKIILVSLIVVLTTYVIFNEVKGMDLHELKKIAEGMRDRDKLLFFVLGLACFSFAAIYDFILAAYYKLNMPKREVFRIGWISQSFNNFIGFGGVAGLTIREFLYDRFNVDKKIVNRIMFIVLFSDLIGLFSLALPSSIGLIQLGQGKFIPLMLIMFSAVIVFIFSYKLPTKYVKGEDSVFSKVQTKLRVYLTLQSTFEWALAALYFAFTIKFFQPEISLIESCIVYVLATIVGIISLIPGGLGSFEGACIILFKMMGYSTPNIVFSLIVCRIGYTIIPWIVGLILLITAPKVKEEKQTLKIADSTALVLSLCVLITGGIIIFSVTMPHLFIKFKFAQRFFPNHLILLNKRITLIVGILLVILSNGIKNRVKVAHNLSVMLLGIATLVYIYKETNYLIAIICLLIGIFLIMNGRYFTGMTEKFNKKHIIIGISAIFISFIVYILIFNIVNKVDFINGYERYSLNFIKNNLLYIGFSIFSVILILIVFLGITRKYDSFVKNSPEEFEKFNEFVKKYPYTPYTYLFNMNDKNFFINKNNTVLFMYRPYKDKILVLGDPIGEVTDFEDAIDELIIWASEKKMKVAFYQVTGKYLESFINDGFKFLKIGESATVNIKEFNLAGKRNKILRKTMNSMEPKGLEFKVLYPPYSREKMEELKLVSDDWLGKKDEMQFSLGAFKENYIQKAPVFVIEDENGKIMAFSNMLLMENTKILSIDLMRHRKNSPDGIMDMLFISMFQWAKENEYDYFDLGIAPLSNVGNKVYSNSKEKLINMAYEYGNKIYGFIGLRKYKNKFDPKWHSVYLAYKDDFNLVETLLALMNVCMNSSKENIDENKIVSKFNI